MLPVKSIKRKVKRAGKIDNNLNLPRDPHPENRKGNQRTNKGMMFGRKDGRADTKSKGPKKITSKTGTRAMLAKRLKKSGLSTNYR